MKPVLCQEWFDWYSPAIANGKWRFEWFWVYGFVCPQTGHTYWWLMPRVNTQTFSRVLEDFAQHFEVGPNKRLALVLDRRNAGQRLRGRMHSPSVADRASWHTTQKLEVPDGIHLVFLPPYSPELQPAERLWPLTNEAIANTHFETIEEIENAVEQRCQALLEMPEFIRGLTQFHWWPTVPVT